MNKISLGLSQQLGSECELCLGRNLSTPEQKLCEQHADPERIWHQCQRCQAVNELVQIDVLRHLPELRQFNLPAGRTNGFILTTNRCRECIDLDDGDDESVITKLFLIGTT